MNTVEKLHDFARCYIPGGVCASYRTNPAIGHPFYVSRGEGPYVYDLDGRQYVDMCMSHGAALLGHNHPAINAAVAKALEVGTVCAYETEYQSALARRISEMVPGAEMVRFAGSGTETVMHALRLARTATGRERVIKFEGHFHGYCDYVYYSTSPPLDQAGPPEAPSPYPQSSGIPQKLRELIIIVPFNDPDALEMAFAQHGRETATLIMEPVNYDAGCIIPQPGFAELCRDLCDRYGVLLFFDEVLTAFRMATGGAQEYLGVTADLAVLGKALGGGMPISAITGRRSIMEHMRPEGESELSGTYLAHLTAVLAALAALAIYREPGFYQRLDALGKQFYGGFQELIDRSGIPVQLQYVGPRFGMHFGLRTQVTNYRQAATANGAMLRTFVAGCIKRGVYFHVSVHHGFSAAHQKTDIDRALEAIEGALHDVAREFPH
jgi:glutamate-1-semialdehyde 2,1-aminomutase